MNADDINSLRSGLGVGAGLNVVACQGMNVSFKYDAELQEAYVSHTFVFEARLKF